MDYIRKQQFLKSDKSLIFIWSILLILTILTIITSWVLGIICWASSTYIDVHNNTSVNGLMILNGFVISIGGTIASIILYYIAMFFLWLAYDIKVIRNAAVDEEDSDTLKRFGR